MSTCPACSTAVSGPPIEKAAPPYHFLRCEGCDLVFTDPMPSVDGEWYRRQQMYLVRDTVAKPKLQWNHRQFLKDLPAHGGRLLDVGCGTGEFLAAASAAGYETFGFDFDAEAVKTAQEQFGLKNIFSGDLWSFAAGENAGQFDVVTAFEVLEHSPTPGEFAADLAKLVRPGGFLAVSVPNRERRPRFQYDWDFPPNHLSRWNKECLAGILRRNGFRILRTANGWRQGESFLHQHLQFGLVTRLLRGGKKSESVALASSAYWLKSTAIRCLAVPLNVGLGLIGETGMTLYVLAKKNDGR